MIYDLIGHGITLAVVIYFGLHLRQKVQTLQTTVAAQEKTITAQEKAITGQAEQMKAQSRVLQDVERFNKMMQQAIDFREQAYLEQDGDHRWNTWVDALPGCAGVYVRGSAHSSQRCR